ncbi:MAG: sialidase family protein, partial [Candidatus Bathyarchaeia archaeon]
SGNGAQLAFGASNGDSWGTFTNITTGTQYSETALVYSNDNRMLALSRIDSGGYIHVFFSDDGGQTWQDIGNANLGSASGVSMATALLNGDTLYITYCDRGTSTVKLSISSFHNIVSTI